MGIQSKCEDCRRKTTFAYRVRREGFIICKEMGYWPIAAGVGVVNLCQKV